MTIGDHKLTLHQRMKNGLPRVRGSEVRTISGESIPVREVIIRAKGAGKADLWEAWLLVNIEFGEPITDPAEDGEQ